MPNYSPQMEKPYFGEELLETFTAVRTYICAFNNTYFVPFKIGAIVSLREN
jgi:hypothetical protein